MIGLSNNKLLYTKNTQSAYKIEDGKALIFIAPKKGDKIGRKILIYEAKKGEVIPSLSFSDHEYNIWHFYFRAVDEAYITEIEYGNTKVLQKKFAEKIGLENYMQEGFNQGLIEEYNKKTLEEEQLIYKSKQQKDTVARDSAKFILNVFDKEGLNISGGAKSDKLYEASKIICEKYGISIASYEKVKACCGDKLTIQDIARVSHFACREIVLEDAWYKQDSGPILAFGENGNPIACVPKGRNKYIGYDLDGENKFEVDDKQARKINIKGYMFYKTFVNKALSPKDIYLFCLENMNKTDLWFVIVLTVIGTAIGVLLPFINEKLVDIYIPLGDETIVINLCVVLCSFMVGNVFFDIVNNLSSFRLSSKMSYLVQNAVYDRLFNLPESFYRNYESADLAQRALSMSGVVSQISKALLTSVLAGVCALFYLIKMFTSSVKLTCICILMILIYAAIVYLISNRSLKYRSKINDLDGKSSSIIYQFINGVDKIRMTGVENRAIFEYYKPFSKKKELESSARYIELIGDTLAAVADATFTFVLYFIIVHYKMEISAGSFIALTSAFGFFTSGILKLVQGLIDINEVKPLYHRAEPILINSSELDNAKELPGNIGGKIEISNLSFSYSPDSPNVINDISLNIVSGEYIGIVGPSGSGKSTLLKLLLGFETPSIGKICYDEKNINSLDKRELRKKFGVVLQDGDLISGSIYDNITITSPQSTLEDVNAVVKAVGLEEDIKNMPMGLHTVLSEGCGTISGGQQQRILIARAIINKPKIILFDEATSALDNITQGMVCESLESLQSTRIVIAHRLSTVINCDRILVMDKGTFTEEGSFAELIEKRGLFYRLAQRQM